MKKIYHIEIEEILQNVYEIEAESSQEAMEIAKEKALPGEAVLLSPACASWGMFPNYEVRGQRFKELVRAMK